MLKIATKAPEFILQDQDKKSHSLSDYKGKWVLLYFYPKDMTPGCTIEACTLRDNWKQFGKLNAVVLGVSKDSVERHKKFAEKEKLPFTLLADPEGNMVEAYEAWGKKSMYGKLFDGIFRISYLIDPDGVIVKTYEKVKPKEHAEEVLRDIQALQK